MFFFVCVRVWNWEHDAQGQTQHRSAAQIRGPQQTVWRTESSQRQNTLLRFPEPQAWQMSIRPTPSPSSMIQLFLSFFSLCVCLGCTYKSNISSDCAWVDLDGAVTLRWDGASGKVQNRAADQPLVVFASHTETVPGPSESSTGWGHFHRDLSSFLLFNPVGVYRASCFTSATHVDDDLKSSFQGSELFSSSIATIRCFLSEF